jgi:hypothetical protein
MTDSVIEGCGMPQDRLARLAARRAFVELKQDFMIASAGLPGHRGEWLRDRVRKAEDPYTLWQLRHSLFTALDGNDPDTCTIRHALKTSLDTLFCDSDSAIASTTSLPRQAAAHGASRAPMPAPAAVRGAHAARPAQHQPA